MRLQERNISIEMQGEDIHHLHTELRNLNYELPLEEIERDFFGEVTRHAVLDFQRKHGLPTTGVVDKRTAQTINAAVEAHRPIPEHFLVRGQVQHQDETPLDGLVIRAFDIGQREETQLGEEVITDAEGHYEIAIAARQVAEIGKRRPDLVVQVLSPEGELLARSAVRSNATDEETINLVVEPRFEPAPEKLQTHTVTLRLLNQETGEPLRGYSVRAFDLDAGEKPADLGFTITNGRGLCSLFYNPMDLVVASKINEGVPNVVGMTLTDARITFEKADLPLTTWFRKSTTDKSYIVLEQDPVAGTKVSGKYYVKLWVTVPEDNPHNTLQAPHREEGGEDQGRRLRLHIVDARGEEIYQTEIRVAVHEQEIVEVRVPVPAIPERPPLSLEELRDRLHPDLPNELLQRLENENIRTIADIRKAGGISRLKNLPVPTDHPAVRALEAHANLSVLSDDLETNATLIRQGFTDVSQIAHAPLSEFKQQMAGQLGIPIEDVIHDIAVAKSMWLENVQTGVAVARVNGYKEDRFGTLAKDKFKEFKQQCVCRDCESAVSPLAYLADLMNYALKNIRITQNNIKSQITIEDLSKRFYQPFEQLQLSCEEMENKVRQVRLCIEVLRWYLNDKNLPAADSQEAKALDKVEEDYHLDAYESLLIKLGTSYEETRLALSEIGMMPHVNEDTKKILAAKLKALGDKLGIDLNAIRLKNLLLTAEERTEERLERLFGLRSMDISRNPLSDGVTFKDNAHQITRWNLEGIEWNRNTDMDGLIYLSLKKQPDVEVYVVDLYCDGNRTKHVAHGEHSSATGLVKVTPINASGLIGFIEIAYLADTECELSAIPALLSWRLQYLRTVWEMKDWPDNNPPADVRPLVDPDLIDGADLRIELDENPAYNLWKNRTNELNEILKKLQDIRKQVGSPSDWLDDMLGEAARDISWFKLSKLDNSRKKGQSIDQELKEHGLTNASFSYLMRIRALAKAAGEITAEEWADIDNILIEVRKRKELYSKWRDKEKEKDATLLGPLCLGPDYFKMRETVLTGYPPAKPKTLPKWRATLTDRLDWEDELESRIDQEKSLINAFWDAVSKTEEETLPALRDALIMASNTTNDDLTTKAKRITERLLIDAQTDSCHETTRISQAIETMQTLLWSLRTGQLADSHPDLTEVPEFSQYFDEEWTWMGSYATWRSAMLVFLYPENILIPTLRRHQTPAFRDLVNNLRKNRNLDPEQACQEAKKYSDYFRDICNLGIEATCNAETQIYEGKCRDRKEIDKYSLFYMFARGRHTNTVYWLAYDPQTIGQEYAQSFWQPLPSIEHATKIVGAHTCRFADNERYIYLFVCVRDKGQKKLVFIRYNLEVQGWDGEVGELDLPEGVEDFDAVLCQRLDDQMPRVAIHNLKTGVIHLPRLGSDGSSWEDELITPGAWADPVLAQNTRRLLSVHELADGTFIVLVESKSGRILRLVLQSDVIARTHNWQVIGPQLRQDWVGSLEWEQKHNAIYVFFNIGIGISYYVTVQSNGAITKGKPSWMGLLPNIARHSGPIAPPLFANQPAHIDERIVAGVYGTEYLAGTHPNTPYRLAIDRDKMGDLSFGLLDRLAPTITGPFDIMERLLARDLQDRQKLIAKAFIDNEDEIKSNLTYLEEAYYFVPIQIALQLQKRGHYISALDWFRTVYDYTISEEDPTEERKIYYGLIAEKDLKGGYQRVQDWLRDPLNPHLIASTRPNTYTRFTLLSIVQCLLDYADAEFTRDTSESVALARTLYETALNLMESKEIKQETDPCPELVIDYPVPEELTPLKWNIEKRLSHVHDSKIYQETQKNIKQLLGTDQPWEARFMQAQDHVDKALAEQATLRTFGPLFMDTQKAAGTAYRALLSNTEIFNTTRGIGITEAKDFSPKPGSSYGKRKRGRVFMSPAKMAFSYCISPNPIPRALRLHAELNLHKLRTCRNIAGMKRTLEPYAAATDQISGLPQIGAGGQLVLPGATTLRPTPYRFSFLVERAKQLVNIAQQMETAMLAALEKRDAEAYSRLKAKQEIELAGAQVKLQTLRVQEAEDGVKLAELQQERAQIQVDQYQVWLDEGKSSMEEASLGLMTATAAVYGLAAVVAFTGSLGMKRAEGLGYTAQALQTTASLLAQWASYERRAQEWQFQKTLAEQDVRIGVQQVKIAEDQVQVVGQERTIALMQKDYAKDTAEFLANKFTNVELYDWMSDILEGIYSYFLQEATAVAKLAENQLGFERQFTPPHYIQNDYWEAPSEDMVAAILPAGNTIDRRGLTGSARLLQDIYQLDQYAIETDKRKLQLTKTISLAAMAPVEFQRFRETGVITFRTPLELFDHDFPGHYLRLVKRVRTSVIALIPPNLGIHATLSTTAASRVVIGGDFFQGQIVRRDPEMVALTSPRDATGLFELQQLPETLLPFEGLGVDTTWELSMPKASNSFDFKTIADVLVSIEYTALHSPDYRQQVLQTLRPRLSADRPFSFRHELSDQWYDLHNPELAKMPNKPMMVQFKTRREDFPPNLEQLKIEHVVLYFASVSGKKFEVAAKLQFRELTTKGLQNPVPNPMTNPINSIDGVISTRRGNASSWTPMIGKMPIGEWELGLPNDQQTKDLFKKEEVEDILFVITYSGRTPEWPV